MGRNEVFIGNSDFEESDKGGEKMEMKLWKDEWD